MRIRLVVLAVLAVLSGCGEPLPINVGADELPIEVEDACEILGLECEAVGDTYGAIELELVALTPPGPPRVRGVTSDGGSCSPSIWVEPDARLIAHELGHALGLEHVDADDVPGGLMLAMRPGLELSDEEMDDIERGGNRLVGCR